MPYNVGAWNSNGISLRLAEMSKSMPWILIPRLRFSMIQTCLWLSTPVPTVSAGIERSALGAA